MKKLTCKKDNARIERERTRYCYWEKLLEIPPLNTELAIGNDWFRIIGINTTQTKIFVTPAFLPDGSQYEVDRIEIERIWRIAKSCIYRSK